MGGPRTHHDEGTILQSKLPWNQHSEPALCVVKRLTSTKDTCFSGSPSQVPLRSWPCFDSTPISAQRAAYHVDHSADPAVNLERRSVVCLMSIACLQQKECGQAAFTDVLVCESGRISDFLNWPIYFTLADDIMILKGFTDEYGTLLSTVRTRQQNTRILQSLSTESIIHCEKGSTWGIALLCLSNAPKLEL